MSMHVVRIWTRGSLLYIPPAIAALSIIYLFSKLLRASLSRRNNKTTPVSCGFNGVAGPEDRGNLKKTVERLDGSVIVLFRLIRLLNVLALLSLEISQISISDVHILQIPLLSYATILATASLITSSRWRDIVSRQLALLLFADIAVYFVLDVWPFVTISPAPFDPSTESATWVRIALLILSAIIIPLVMPRPFRPAAPGEESSKAETASLFSRYTYSYLDAIVLYAYRAPDITVKDMPELPARGKIEALGQRALALLDPVKTGKRHFLWNVLRVWGIDYLKVSLITIIYGFTQFAGPYGTRKILEYLETDIPPNNLQPWAWIAVLVIGPLISACLFTHYLYIGTRVIVENRSAFTYLVFHHALRIRLKSDVLDTKEQGKDQLTPTSGSAQTENTHSTATDTESSGSEEIDSFDDATTAPEADIDSKTTSEDIQTQKKAGHLLGKINNLITTDLAAIGNVHIILSLPGAIVELTISIVFLYSLVGWSALVGLALLLLGSLLPLHIGQLMSKAQRSKMGATDKRVQFVTESLGILRMIKLFAWEGYMLKQLSHWRDKELANLRRFRLLRTTMYMASSMLPLISKLVVIAIFTLVSKGDLTASRIFSALMVFSIMEEQLKVLMFIIPEMLRAKVSYDRYSDFFNSTELLTEGNDLHDEQEAEHANTVTSRYPGADTIGFKECTFSWDSFDKRKIAAMANRHGRKQFKLRFKDEVVFKRGQVNIIVGPTASGKTSTLMALLGEMYYKPDGLDSWYSLPRDGGVAYAPQESWVLNATIKDNILFGASYDEGRYEKVLRHCALERDLSLWEAGDLTEVGEKGLTLSGGQKARVTLARALYSSASILLLDDILSALDVHTAKWIVDQALQGELIRDRTVLLVTHNIALAAPVASHVLVLNRNGEVSAQGPVSEILKKDASLRARVEKEREEVEEVIDAKPEEEVKTVEDQKKILGKLVVAEEKAMGRVEMSAIMLYVSSIGSPFIWSLILGTRLLGIALSILQTWFIGYWSNQYESHDASDVSVLKYLGLFALINSIGFLTELATNVLWVFKSLRAAKIIHLRLLQSIFTASFRWLDVTPVGRIITRCTQDMSTIDEDIGDMLGPFLSITINLVCLFLSSVVMAGWFALISGLAVAILGGLFGWVYLKCKVPINRETSNAKAPVLSQVGTTLSGLPSIRAYKAQNMFRVELERRIDLFARTSYCNFDVSRWVAIRMDSFGAIFSGVVAFYLVYGRKVQAGYAGFTLSVVLAFSRLILSWVRMYFVLEVQANRSKVHAFTVETSVTYKMTHYSLERILGFLCIEHEPKQSMNGAPPAYWPSSGSIRVENLSARYSDGERVGVVGRTGAGKSSIALSLLRAIKTNGKVYYDGIATDEISLEALRSNITLIPQQPELINGTLRENLDPFGQHEDATLNDALSAAGFFSINELAIGQQKLVNGEQSNVGLVEQNGVTVERSAKIGLDTMVESGGTNFSLGQRQIIALARAIVRRSKLLILDEATAAIDYDTDAVIQKTLRTEFSKDTTLITIAHRLQTIVDYDKIMVLDAGELVEFDSPKNLMTKEGGYFRSLIDESDDRELLLEAIGK